MGLSATWSSYKVSLPIAGALDQITVKSPFQFRWYSNSTILFMAKHEHQVFHSSKVHWEHAHSQAPHGGKGTVPTSRRQCHHLHLKMSVVGICSGPKCWWNVGPAGDAVPLHHQMEAIPPSTRSPGTHSQSRFAACTCLQRQEEELFCLLLQQWRWQHMPLESPPDFCMSLGVYLSTHTANLWCSGTVLVPGNSD